MADKDLMKAKGGHARRSSFSGVLPSRMFKDGSPESAKPARLGERKKKEKLEGPSFPGESGEAGEIQVKHIKKGEKERRAAREEGAEGKPDLGNSPLTASPSSAPSTSSTSSTSSASSTPSNASSSARQDHSPTKSHWRIFDGESVGNKQAQVRGENRRRELESLRRVMRHRPDQALREAGELWVRQFQACATDFFRPVSECMQVEAQRPEIRKALLDPEKSVALLRASFFTVLDVLLRHEGRSVTERLGPDAKAMAFELLHQLRTASRERDQKLDMNDLWTKLLADLFLFSLAGDDDQPASYANAWGVFLAGCFGRPALERELAAGFSQILVWAEEANKTCKPDSLFSPLIESFSGSPLQRITLRKGQPELEERISRVKRGYESWAKIWGMDRNGSDDPRFIPPFAREIGTEVKRIKLEPGMELDISSEPDKLHELLNKYPAQGLQAQICCSQLFSHYALDLCLLSATPVRDGQGRKVLIGLGKTAEKYLIERREDDSLRIKCKLVLYQEELKVEDSKGDWVKARPLLPAWVDCRFVVTVSKFGAPQLDIESLSAEVYNLHALDDEWSTPAKAEPEMQRSGPKAKKALRRLSMVFAEGSPFKEKEKEKGSN